MGYPVFYDGPSRQRINQTNKFFETLTEYHMDILRKLGFSGDYDVAYTTYINSGLAETLYINYELASEITGMDIRPNKINGYIYTAILIYKDLSEAFSSEALKTFLSLVDLKSLIDKYNINCDVHNISLSERIKRNFNLLTPLADNLDMDFSPCVLTLYNYSILFLDTIELSNAINSFCEMIKFEENNPEFLDFIATLNPREILVFIYNLAERLKIRSEKRQNLESELILEEFPKIDASSLSPKYDLSNYSKLKKLYEDYLEKCFADFDLK